MFILLLWLLLQQPMFMAQNVTSASAGPPAGALATYNADSIATANPTTWPDTSGNNNTLTAHNATWAANQYGSHGGVTFNGTSTYFTPASSINCTNPCTLYAQLKVISYTGSAGIITGNATTNGEFTAYTYTDGRLILDADSIANVGQYTGPVTTGSYIRLAFTYSGSNWAIYVNGTSVASGTSTATISNQISEFGTTNTQSTSFLNAQVTYMTLYAAGYNSAVDTYLAGR